MLALEMLLKRRHIFMVQVYGTPFKNILIRDFFHWYLPVFMRERQKRKLVKYFSRTWRLPVVHESEVKKSMSSTAKFMHNKGTKVLG